MKTIMGLTLIGCVAHAIDQFDGTEFSTETTANLEWDAPLLTDPTRPPPEFYEVKLVYIDSEPNIEYPLGRTPTTAWTINFPRSGHFLVKVRSGRWDDTTNAEVFSEWAGSDDEGYAVVDGEARAFRVRKVMGQPEW